MPVVTLARAHKIVERLAARMGELREQASSVVAVTVATPPTEELIARINERAASAFEAAEAYEVRAAAHAKLRETIAQANARLGITEVLAQVEANRRLISLYADMVTALKPLATTAHVDTVVKDDFVWPQAPQSVTITAVRESDIDELLARKRALERQNFALTDKLAELNAKTIEIELSDELIEEVGL